MGNGSRSLAAPRAVTPVLWPIEQFGLDGCAGAKSILLGHDQRASLIKGSNSCGVSALRPGSDLRALTHYQMSLYLYIRLRDIWEYIGLIPLIYVC